MSAFRIIAECWHSGTVLFLLGDDLRHYPDTIPASLKRDLAQDRAAVVRMIRQSARFAPCLRCGAQLIALDRTLIRCIDCGLGSDVATERRRAAAEKAIDTYYKGQIAKGQQP